MTAQQGDASEALRRFLALDAWRGICALVVALLHLNVANPLRVNAFIDNGIRFVDFFFVLSGFVIAHAYRRNLAQHAVSAASFLIRRLGRLWPLHMVMLTAFVVFELAIWVASSAGVSTGRLAFSEDNTLDGLLPSVLLVQAWGLIPHDAFNVPAWSISCELFAYLLFALICVKFPRAVGWVAVALIAISLVLLLAVAPNGMGSTFDFGLARCVFGFMVGVLVRRLWALREIRVGTGGEALLVAAVIAAVIWLPSDGWGVLIVPIFGVTVWVFAAESGAVSRAMRAGPLQRLGAWSYSIYMVHAFIAIGALTIAFVATKAGLPLFEQVSGRATIVGSVPVTTAVVLVYVAVVVAVSSCTYRWIEQPGQRRANNLARAHAKRQGLLRS